MSDDEFEEIAIELIYNYLNDPSKYTKFYIHEKFNSAITILSKKLKDYFNVNGNIKSMQQGQRQVTYKDVTIKNLIEDIKFLLPTPVRRTGIVYV